jgi:heme iron utilization protein
MKNANKARELTGSQQMGVLSTVSRRLAGFPFGSVVGYALDAEARPLFLISGLAVHFRNLEGDPRASLTIFEDEAQTDPMNAARVTLMGEIHRVPDAEVADARAAYVARHPDSEQWAGFGDFAFFRMELRDIYFIGGFGSMGWVMPEDYRAVH